MERQFPIPSYPSCKDREGATGVLEGQRDFWILAAPFLFPGMN